MDNPTTYVAFHESKCVASGPLESVLKTAVTKTNAAQFLIFRVETGEQVDFDFRRSIEEILDMAQPKPARTGPGRPRLGVTSREVSLMPRHWEWLEAQKSGASATLRRLVDEARKRNPGEAQTRAAIEATGRVMTALAGNFPGFEEAYRALYARDRARLAERVSEWPEDVRAYVLNHFDAALAS